MKSISKRPIAMLLALMMILSLVMSNGLPGAITAYAASGFEISDASGLSSLANKSGNYKLTNDIDLTGAWTPIAGFTGTLDGQGYTISGLTLTEVGTNSTDGGGGLFATLEGGATVENLTIELGGNVTVSGSSSIFGITDDCYAGALAGYIESSTIKYVTVLGNGFSISSGGGNFAGGLAGKIKDSYVSNSRVTGAGVDGAKNIGGFAGDAINTDFYNCNVDGTGSVSSTSDASGAGTGGFVGTSQYSNYSYCHVSKTVTGYENVGGLIGYVINTTTTPGSYEKVTNCSVTLDGVKYIKSLSTGDAHAGGLIGWLGSPMDVTNCTVTGSSVTAPSAEKVGGLIGNVTAVGSNVTNCYIELSKVTGDSYVGGLVGRIDSGDSGGTFDNNRIYVDDIKAAKTYVGGIAGYAFNPVLTRNLIRGNVTSNGSTFDILLLNISCAGGFVGYLYHGVITECGWEGGAVYGPDRGVSGMIGIVRGSVGIATPAKKDDIGEQGIILKNCYARGGVTGGNWVGGMVGYVYGDTDMILETSYVAGALEGGERTGAIIGYAAPGGGVGTPTTLYIDGIYYDSDLMGGVTPDFTTYVSVTQAMYVNPDTSLFGDGLLDHIPMGTTVISLESDRISGRPTSEMMEEAKFGEDMLIPITFLDEAGYISEGGYGYASTPWGIDDGLTYPYLWPIGGGGSGSIELTLTPLAETLEVPVKSSESVQFTAEVTDSSGVKLPVDVVWSIAASDGGNLPGVSINEYGVVTVTDSACKLAYHGKTVTVTASYGGVSDTAVLTLTLHPALLDINDSVDADDMKTAIEMLYDGESGAVALGVDEELWNEYEGLADTDKERVHDYLFDNLPYESYAEFVQAFKIIMAEVTGKPLPAAASIQITPDKHTAILPVSGEVSVVYEARIYDGDGDEMLGCTVDWSFTSTLGISAVDLGDNLYRVTIPYDAGLLFNDTPDSGTTITAEFLEVSGLLSDTAILTVDMLEELYAVNGAFDADAMLDVLTKGNVTALGVDEAMWQKYADADDDVKRALAKDLVKDAPFQTYQEFVDAFVVGDGVDWPFTANPVDEGDNIVTGTGEPGTEIEVTWPDGTTDSTTVDEDGKWSIEVPDDMELTEGDKIIVKNEDGEIIEIIVGGGGGDDWPFTVNPVDEGDKTVTGTGEPGTEIEVTWPDGTTDSTTVDEDGKWSIQVPDDMELKEGDKITAENEDGKVIEVIVGGGGTYYTVSFDSLGGTAVASQTVKAGEKIIKPADPTKDRYIFDGWYTYDDTAYDFDTPVSSSFTVFAKWTFDDIYIVTYMADGEEYDAEWVNLGEKAIGPDEDPIKLYYNFDGWYTGDGILWDFDDEIGEDLTLYAAWMPKLTVDPVEEDDTTITGTGEPGTEIEVTWPDGTTDTTTVDEDGNWFIEVPEGMDLEDGDEIIVKDGDGNIIEVIVGGGEPEAIFYTVNFDSLGGTAVVSQVIKDGEKATEPADPTKDNYVFDGWYTYSGAEYDFDTAVTGNFTLYAKWVSDGKHTVTFLVDGEVYAANRVDDGAKVEKPADPAKTGYIFDGWYLYDRVYDFDTQVTGDLTLYATWTPVITPVNYTVTYDANGGSGTAPIESDKAFRETFSAASNTFTAPDGYKFKEWNTKADGKGIAYAVGDSITMPAENLILYAIWEKISSDTYTVTFDSNGGTAVASQTVKAGEKIIKPADPTKDRYIFDGWYTYDGKAYDFGTPVSSSFTLFAKWTFDGIYKVTYMADGKAYGAEWVKAGEKAKGPGENPTKLYYNFEGWYTGGGIRWNFNDKINEDLTLYAKWTAKLTVDPVEEGDKTITGKGEPGTEIEVTWPDGSKGTTTVDKDGNWSIKVPDDVELKKGDKIIIKDEDGNTVEVIVGSGQPDGTDGKVGNGTNGKVGNGTNGRGGSGTGSTPKTGDNISIWLWLALLGVSTLCIARIALLRKKELFGSRK